MERAAEISPFFYRKGIAPGSRSALTTIAMKNRAMTDRAMADRAMTDRATNINR
jgi:hypothetical protein